MKTNKGLLTESHFTVVSLKVKRFHGNGCTREVNQFFTDVTEQRIARQYLPAHIAASDLVSIEPAASQLILAENTSKFLN